MISKPFISIIAILLLSAVSVNSQTSDNNVVASILSSYSARAFSTEPISDAEIEQILQCGIKAPSGKNSQPWRFTVVQDTALINKILPRAVDGNVLIIVSGLDAEQGKTNIYFNCGLATENMYVAAQGLGLGAHIYGGARKINESMKDVLGIPEAYGAVSVLRIGNVDKSVDAVSSASPRNDIKTVVNYK